MIIIDIIRDAEDASIALKLIRFNFRYADDFSTVAVAVNLLELNGIIRCRLAYNAHIILFVFSINERFQQIQPILQCVHMAHSEQRIVYTRKCFVHFDFICMPFNLMEIFMVSIKFCYFCMGWLMADCELLSLLF